MTDTENVIPQPISKTYKDMVNQFLDESPVKREAYDPLQIQLLESFAKYLDSMPTLMPHMELLVMRKSREIDREFMHLLIAEIDPIRVKELAQQINDRHVHTKKDPDAA